MRKKFFEEIPFVRAIACIMVVMVHVTSGTITADDGSSNTLNLYLYQLTRLGTPIFAVISAFLLFGSVRHNGFNFKHFFVSRTTKIVLPFLLWTFFYLWVQDYFDNRDVFADPEKTIKYFILGKGYYHLYFMVTVIQFYLVFPLLQFIHNRRVMLGAFFLSLPFNAQWLLDHQVQTGIDLLDAVLMHRSFIMNWISFFLFGAVLASYYEDILFYVKRRKMLFLGIAVLLFAVLTMEIDPEHIFTSSRPVNLVYVPVFVLFLLSIQAIFAKIPFLIKGLNVIGNYSMGIYLVHPFVKVVLKDYLPESFWDPSLILVTIGLIFAISMIIVRLILLIPKSNYIVPIGKAKRPEKANTKDRVPSTSSSPA